MNIEKLKPLLFFEKHKLFDYFIKIIFLRIKSQEILLELLNKLR